MRTIPPTNQGGDELAQPDQAKQPGMVTGATEANAPPPRVLSPAAQRALAEAEERRRLRDTVAETHPTEVGGRGGLDPVRFGDWEKGGICWDF
jgi:hypothetical protein